MVQRNPLFFNTANPSKKKKKLFSLVLAEFFERIFCRKKKDFS